MFRSDPNRYLCDILRDMRKAIKVLRIDMLSGLIEEAQIYGNRMEAKLDDQYDMRRLLEDKSVLNEEVRALRKKKEALEKELESKE